MLHLPRSARQRHGDIEIDVLVEYSLRQRGQHLTASGDGVSPPFILHESDLECGIATKGKLTEHFETPRLASRLSQTKPAKLAANKLACTTRLG